MKRASFIIVIVVIAIGGALFVWRFLPSHEVDPAVNGHIVGAATIEQLMQNARLYDADAVVEQKDVLIQELSEGDVQYSSHLAMPAWIDLEGMGIVIDTGYVARFYPFQVLHQHEIVNDVVSGQPILVAYCSVCKTAIAYNPMIDGTYLSFETTPYIWNGSTVIVNRENDSMLWTQADGTEIAHNARKMDVISFDIITYEDFARQYPEGEIMIGNEAYIDSYVSVL